MRLLLSSLIVVIAVAFSASADAKQEKARGPAKGAKPAKIEKKVKKGKHDLDAVIKGKKGKGKGKGKGKAKGKAVEAAKAADVASTADEGAPAEPAVAAAKADPKGHAWGKDKKFHELSKHLKRLAKLKRLEEIATTSKNDGLLTKVKMLVDKEQKRHERVVARVETKGSIKDEKEAAKKAD